MTNEAKAIDSALQLKQFFRNNDFELPASSEIQAKLEESAIITKILAESYRTDTFTGLRKLEFLLAELSEIPFFETLAPVQTMLDTLYAHANSGEGYSLTGKQDGVLACHHALMTLIFIRAGKRNGRKRGFNGLSPTCLLIRMNHRLGKEKISSIVLAVVLEIPPATMDW